LFIYVLPLCLILQSCQTFLLFEAIKVIIYILLLLGHQMIRMCKPLSN
jgi:hypothetical protein